jgi:hypothetical protein
MDKDISGYRYGSDNFHYFSDRITKKLSNSLTPYVSLRPQCCCTLPNVYLHMRGYFSLQLLFSLIKNQRRMYVELRGQLTLLDFENSIFRLSFYWFSWIVWLFSLRKIINIMSNERIIQIFQNMKFRKWKFSSSTWLSIILTFIFYYFYI